MWSRRSSGRAATTATLGDVALCSEFVTLVLAGHETTSTALTWYLLALL